MMRRTPGERWYRALLRLYPREFREDFGGEMTRLYRDRRREEPASTLWRSLVVDVLRTAPSEHLSMLRQDLRHAWRSLRHAPIVTATAILTLALGVGASTSVFSAVHAVLLRPIPYPEPDRLVELFEGHAETGAFWRVSALNYLSWAERSRSFDAVGAFRNAGLTMTENGDPELLAASVMTASVFRVLRVEPIVGRILEQDDEQGGASRVVVISESLWRSRFGAEPQIVGRAIVLDGERHRVVGVMPRPFREVGRSQIGATGGAQIFLPMRIDPSQENRGNHTLRAVGRLRHGVSLEQARSEMRAVAAAMAREFPATNANWSVTIEPVASTMIDPQVRRSLLLVLGAVAMVFLIGCVNVANLLLVRGSRRHHEFALRTALGASRSRLVRQLLTESGLLAGISGAAGIAAAAIAQPMVRSLLPITLPRLDEMHIDRTILAFGVLISVVSALVFGAIPALRASKNVSHSLTSIGRATGDRSRVRLRHALIAAQVALATMLLVCAGLLIQAFNRLQHVPLGFEPEAVLTARVSLPRSAYPDAARAGAFYDRLLTTLEGSGRLRAVAVATSAPFAPGVRAGFPLPNREGAAEHIVSGAYFRVLGMPILAGRSFDENDDAGSTPVAIVSQRVARMLWPDMSPLGQLLERGGRSYEIVGVVGDIRGSDTQGVRGGGRDRDPRAAVYLAAAQLPQRTMTLLILPAGEPAGLLADLRNAVRQIDPTLAVQQVRPLRDWLTESVAPVRLTTTLATVFALSALLLTTVGIYGVLAYSVSSRTREIGVRIAIGATRPRVVRLVLREGMIWAGSGIVVGLIGALASARVMAALLFDVGARDPLTFSSVGVAMAMVALLACAIPAARAVRIDPTVAMRAE